MLNESITKASQTSNLLLSDLQDCYRSSSPIQEIIVRQILREAVELERRITELAAAVKTGGN